MNEFWLYIVIPAGAAVVAVLAGYAGMIWLRKVRATEDRSLRDKNRNEEKIAYLTDSVSRLADAMLNHDLNLSEGGIRLKVMLDHLLPEAERQDYAVLYEFESRVNGFERGEARNNLNGMQRLLQDAERERIEAEFRSGVLEAARRVIEQFGAPQIGQERNQRGH